MAIKVCIKFSSLWLFLFAPLSAETTIVPYNDNLNTHQVTQAPQTTFLDFVWVLVQTLLIVAAFILFLYLGVYLFKRLTERRFSSRIQGEDIKILERALLSNKSAIYLLEIKNKHFLIGESNNGLTQLGTFYNE